VPAYHAAKNFLLQQDKSLTYLQYVADNEETLYRMHNFHPWLLDLFYAYESTSKVLWHLSMLRRRREPQ
jgi:hypothetical protein